MGSAEQAADLRRQADALEAQGELEKELTDAKAAYRESKSDEDKERHRAAADALTKARKEGRPEGAAVIGGDALVEGDPKLAAKRAQVEGSDN